MNFKHGITLTDIMDLVKESLQDFYSNDSILLDYYTENDAVAERCMVFRIGWYMLNRICKADKFNWADIDCEYNRNFDHPKSMYKLTLDGISEKIKDMIPDLLIHKRRENENNLLVIEFKKGTPTATQKANDVEKLLYFTDTSKEYGYDYGLYIELHKRSATIQVYQAGKHKSHLDFSFIPTFQK